MQSNFDDLIKLCLSNIEKVHDYWHIQLGENYLTIYNPVKIIGGKTSDPQHEIEGVFLQDVTQKDTSLVLHFSNEMFIEVDLRDEVYEGPEAMVLRKKTGEIIVW